MSVTEDPEGFFTQSDAIVDYVFPLCNVEVTEEGVRYSEFLGTGFFVGARGYALTAAHVLEKATTPAIMMRGRDQSWRAFAVSEGDPHPTEDVAILRVESPAGQQWRSIFALPGAWAGPSLGYFLWGYPAFAAFELVEDDRALFRPDLIYSEGHVRRRMTNIPLPLITGTTFLELSQVAGGGCSGSPVLNKASLGQEKWQLVGIYVGERSDTSSIHVGYAVRLNEIRDWEPAIIGQSLASECNAG